MLSLLASLIAASRDSALKEINSEEVFLLPFKDDILGVLVLGLMGKSSLRPAIEGLSGLVTTVDLLDDDEIGFVVQKVNDVISGQHEDPGTRCLFSYYIAKISVAHSSIAMQPSIFSKPFPARRRPISHS